MPYSNPERQKAYLKEWNKKFYEKNKAATYARVKKRRNEIRRWLDEYRSTLSCVKCGESHPACLDFHHRDSKTKEFGLGNISGWGYGKQKLLREIEKCEVLCANCHRKAHFKAKK